MNDKQLAGNDRAFIIIDGADRAAEKLQIFLGAMMDLIPRGTRRIKRSSFNNTRTSFSFAQSIMAKNETKNLPLSKNKGLTIILTCLKPLRPLPSPHNRDGGSWAPNRFATFPLTRVQNVSGIYSFQYEYIPQVSERGTKKRKKKSKILDTKKDINRSIIIPLPFPFFPRRTAQNEIEDFTRSILECRYRHRNPSSTFPGDEEHVKSSRTQTDVSPEMIIQVLSEFKFQMTVAEFAAAVTILENCL